MAIDHFGITAPGESWKAVEDGTVLADGPLPINPSGGLIGCGHPVGASGVRMLLDVSKQVQLAGRWLPGGRRDDRGDAEHRGQRDHDGLVRGRRGRS